MGGRPRTATAMAGVLVSPSGATLVGHAPRPASEERVVLPALGASPPSTPTPGALFP